jgi:signal transduction histidine kinase
MTLSRQFMDWATASSKRSKPAIPVEKAHSPEFRALCIRILLSYLGTMAAVIGIFTFVVYNLYTRSLYSQLDEQLQTLAEAASQNLPALLKNPRAIARPIPATVDNDGDLDLPWQDLRESAQSVEWFDPQRRIIGKAGRYLPNTPLKIQSRIHQGKDLRQLILPVYAAASSAPSQQTLQGYIRVSTSIAEVEEDSGRLLQVLSLGGAIAILLIAITGSWLTQRSVQPIERGVLKLQQFTADASHELRSPITAIRTAVQVMQSHPDRIHPADENKLTAIASATYQMSELIEDLLLLARSDNPVISDRLAIPIDELLEDLVIALQPQAIAKGITLTLHPTPEVRVQADATSMRRLFSNLLENALQYTPSGGSVNVELIVQSAIALTRVSDTGIGIAPEQMPWVFHRFWRAEQARSHRQTGAGLGLALAEAIAQSHSGEITVTSQLGIGSCFSVKLPLLKSG